MAILRFQVLQYATKCNKNVHAIKLRRFMINKQKNGNYV